MRKEEGLSYAQTINPQKKSLRSPLRPSLSIEFKGEKIPGAPFTNMV